MQRSAETVVVGHGYAAAITLLVVAYFNVSLSGALLDRQNPTFPIAS